MDVNCFLALDWNASGPRLQVSFAELSPDIGQEASFFVLLKWRARSVSAVWCEASPSLGGNNTTWRQIDYASPTPCQKPWHVGLFRDKCEGPVCLRCKPRFYSYPTWMIQIFIFGCTSFVIQGIFFKITRRVLILWKNRLKISVSAGNRMYGSRAEEHRGQECLLHFYTTQGHDCSDKATRGTPINEKPEPYVLPSYGPEFRYLNPFPLLLF